MNSIEEKKKVDSPDCFSFTSYSVNYNSKQCFQLSPAYYKSFQKRGEAEKVYVVFVGRIPGVYNTWEEAKTQVDKFSNAYHKSFKKRDEAEKACLEYRRGGDLETYYKSFQKRGEAEKVYVVFVGRIPEIYNTWEEAKTQADKFSNAYHKSFKNREVAEKAFLEYRRDCDLETKMQHMNLQPNVSALSSNRYCFNEDYYDDCSHWKVSYDYSIGMLCCDFCGSEMEDN